LFGPEWTKPDPPKPPPKRVRRRRACPDWIADACHCPNCGRKLVTNAGKYEAIHCPKPGCAGQIPRSLFCQGFERSHAAEREIHPGVPDLARCLRQALSYLRGRTRRKGEP
jgi:hypothetical protein